MRPDMSKVLVERPRTGRYSKRKGRPVRDPDLLRAKLTGLRLARENGGAKHPGENLAPLRRYIERQEGRPWNKVFSEMREHIKPGNTVQEHILTHLADYIALEVDRVEPSANAPCGVVRCQHHRWGAGRPLGEGELYVDPVDGIIKRTRRRLKGPRHIVPSGANRIRFLRRDEYAIALDGKWRAATLIPYTLETDPQDPWRTVAFKTGQQRHEAWNDPLEGVILPWHKGRLAALADRYGQGKLAYAIRELSRQERQRHRLRDAAGS